MKALIFTARYCSVCVSAMPNIITAAERCGVNVEKVDVERDPDVANDFGVKELPTVLLLDGAGGMVDMVQGGFNQAFYEDWFRLYEE